MGFLIDHSKVIKKPTKEGIEKLVREIVKSSRGRLWKAGATFARRTDDRVADLSTYPEHLFAPKDAIVLTLDVTSRDDSNALETHAIVILNLLEGGHDFAEIFLKYTDLSVEVS